MAAPKSRHSLRRTSPKGLPFVGTCALCGQKGLTMTDFVATECPNIRGLSMDEALLEAIEPDLEPSP